MALSQTAFARLAGTSQKAVSLAVRSSHLVPDAAGKLDPAEPRNEAWINTHRAGWGGRSRPLSTWRNGRGTGGDSNAREPEHSGLDELLTRWGEEVQIDPAFADRLLDELETDAGRVILAAVLAALPGEFAALRKEVADLGAVLDALRVERSAPRADAPRADAPCASCSAIAGWSRFKRAEPRGDGRSSSRLARPMSRIGPVAKFPAVHAAAMRLPLSKGAGAGLNMPADRETRGLGRRRTDRDGGPFPVRAGGAPRRSPPASGAPGRPAAR